jgi:Arc/MetJ family transcription regulator
VKLTIEIDDEVVARARRWAEGLGTSVEELVGEYLVRLADANADADEFERLSGLAQGDSRGWKFNREEIHER